jgi:TgpA N-terminal domain/Transglutaminase-like superfamily/Domain of unknown function (DUF4129)
MRLDTTFRLSFYVTLGLACACLAQAEAFFMEWLAWACVPLAAAVFALAWRNEGRWVIQETTSNYLGILILFATGAWFLVQLPRSEDELIAGGVPYPAGVLPHLGVLLLMLLGVKLFRPKLMPDFWVIQTIGLMVVTLSCVLAGDLWFTGLLLAYLTSLVWCLALFHVYRARRPSDGPLFAPAGAPADPAPVPWHRLGLGKSLGWSLVVLFAGMPVFLAMPRSSTSQWVPQKLSSSAASTLTVGVDAGINLNRVGTIELSSNPAFHASVRDAFGKPASIPMDQLWRVDVLDYYVKGQWLTRSQADEILRANDERGGAAHVAGPQPAESQPAGSGAADTPAVRDQEPALKRPTAGAVSGSAYPSAAGPVGGKKGPSAVGTVQVPQQKLTMSGPPVTPSLPEPRPEQRYLTYAVRPPDAGGLVLAEPLDLRHVGIDPWVGESRPSWELFMAVPGGTAAFMPSRRLTYTYTQVIVPNPGTDRQPAGALDPSYRDYLLNSAVPEDIVTWAQRQVSVSTTRLTVAERHLDDAGQVAPEHHAAVSQELCRYLALSGDFTYTLKLKRAERNLDPTVDFLKNVRSGHCERFAALLTLGLRGLGIPARIIKGYRGADEEQSGEYVVRLDQAHSWVQALVRDGDGWVWLTLDPTPGQGATTNRLTTWVAWMRDLDAEDLWRRFVLNYNSEVQRSTLQYLGQGIWQSAIGRNLLWQVPACLGAAAALMVAWHRRGRWRRLGRHGVPSARTAAAPRFYRRLLRVLSRRLDLHPEPGQTPLEFATAAGRVLAQRAATAHWSQVPVQSAEALYRIRFANEPLSPVQDSSLQQQIAALATALAERSKQ